MWLLTTQGFYSVVQDREDPGRLLVRARTQGDIEALTRQIPGLQPFELETADYRWRALVSKDDWASAVTELVHEIDYDNFKNSVRDRQGREREHLYHEVWHKLHDCRSATRR